MKAIVNHIENNPKKEYKRKWVVIDKDDYKKEQINSAIERAKQLDICVAISNESYELWLLLHFKNISRSTGRKSLKSQLNKIFKEKYKVDYTKSSKDIYNFVIGEQPRAIQNAKALARNYINVDGCINPFLNNPLTTIYELVEYLNNIYSEENSGTNKKCYPKNNL